MPAWVAVILALAVALVAAAATRWYYRRAVQPPTSPVDTALDDAVAADEARRNAELETRWADSGREARDVQDVQEALSRWRAALRRVRPPRGDQGGPSGT